MRRTADVVVGIVDSVVVFLVADMMADLAIGVKGLEVIRLAEATGVGCQVGHLRDRRHAVRLRGDKYFTGARARRQVVEIEEDWA